MGTVCTISSHAQGELTSFDFLTDLIKNDPLVTDLGTPINLVSVPAVVSTRLTCTFNAAQAYFPQYFRGPMTEVKMGPSYMWSYAPEYARQHTEILSMSYDHTVGDFIVKWSVGGETNFGSIAVWFDAAGC